jgi:hypothetical protein
MSYPFMDNSGLASRESISDVKLQSGCTFKIQTSDSASTYLHPANISETKDKIVRIEPGQNILPSLW